ncbi:PREDICTED: ankyrin-2-like [Branchiostoma belcheri]|uniref:Ankyrin-2-like n=1 Tax=Branchiostoma belcheri TaxID=7741 RepID=A0A6P5A347_BRABE|nr:PREDICTED: ankyrin-2-like [Branchiostoma belcheri]
MQYSTSSSPAVTWEPAMWVTEDKSKWTTLKTMDTEETQLKDTLAVSVDHFSIFAVVSQLKQDRFFVPTRGCTLTSSTHPTVQIIFPKQSVTSQMEVVVQVQDISRSQVEDIKKRHESSCGLISTSPFVKVETVGDSIVKFNKAVTVRVPHPQHYMDIQDEAPAKVKVLSCEKGADDWIDMADGTNIRVTQTTVEFEVTHFTR